MTEEERKKKITEFYNRYPDRFACDDCVTEIGREQVERSVELTGLRYCGFCLSIILIKEPWILRPRRRGF